MTIRAKFKVQSITRQAGWNEHKILHNIALNPVTAGSEENKAFYAATPGGQINLSVVPDTVGKQFEIGDEFYVDFIKAPKPEQPAS